MLAYEIFCKCASAVCSILSMLEWMLHSQMRYSLSLEDKRKSYRPTWGWEINKIICILGGLSLYMDCSLQCKENVYLHISWLSKMYEYLIYECIFP